MINLSITIALSVLMIIGAYTLVAIMIRYFRLRAMMKYYKIDVRTAQHLMIDLHYGIYVEKDTP